MKKSTYIDFGIFMGIIVIGLFWFNSNNEPKIREVQIDAKWFEFNPNEIKVKRGDQVVITISNIDVDHGITIPDLGVSGNEIVTFTAERKGEFTFYCNNFCGVDHDKMMGKIIVE